MFDGRRISIELEKGLENPRVVFKQNQGETEKEFNNWQWDAEDIVGVDYDDGDELVLLEPTNAEKLLKEITGVLNNVHKRLAGLDED